MSKKSQSTGTDDERSQCDFDPFDERPRRSRFAKEARIGLGVIFVLLVVLGVVLYQQMTGVDQSPSASAEAESSEAEGEETSAPKGPQSESPAPEWSQPRVIAAKAGSSDAAQKDPTSNLDSWRVTVEDSNADTAAQSPSPSFMPKLVAATPSGRYSDHRSTQTADNREPYDSFRRSSTQAVAGGAEIEVSDAAGPVGPRIDSAQSASAPLPDAYQKSNSLRDTAQQAQVPTYKKSPHSSYRTYPELSAPTRQVDASVRAPAQIDVSQQDPSKATLAPSDPTRQWMSGANPVRSKPGLNSVSSRTPVQAALGQRYTAGNSPGKAGTYVVQPNDSYWVISERLYGTGAYFRALAQHNRSRIPDENRLRVGEQILAPDASELEKAYPDLCPKLAHRKAAQRRTSLTSTQNLVGAGRVYVVQQGDNLFDIARYELGKATRWTEIVDLNHQLLGADLNELNYLTPGMRLILPDDRQRPAANVARQPGSAYQR